MWDQRLVIHNQPAECRTWACRPFLLKVTADGRKPKNIKAHLQFFAGWKHRLATSGIALGPGRTFVTDGTGNRIYQKFANVTLWKAS